VKYHDYHASKNVEEVKVLLYAISLPALTSFCMKSELALLKIIACSSHFDMKIKVLWFAASMTVGSLHADSRSKTQLLITNRADFYAKLRHEGVSWNYYIRQFLTGKKDYEN
jgi:hypothetical protein